MLVKELIITQEMFSHIPCSITPKGRVVQNIKTEVMPHQTLGKTKMSALMPVLNWISKDWGLNLSRTHDRLVAFRILKNSVIKN